LWRYVSANNWVNVPGTVKSVAVVGDNRYFCIGSDNNVFRFTGSTWVRVGVSASAISAGSDGTVLVTNSSTNGIWKYVSDNNWVNVPGKMKSLAVLGNNRYFGIGMDNNVYRFNGSAWVQVGVAVSSIAAGADGTVLVTNNANNAVWQYVSDNVWSPVSTPSPINALSVVALGRYFGIDMKANVLKN
jgi:galactose oxidase